jgi:hypothetical protein
VISEAERRAFIAKRRPMTAEELNEAREVLCNHVEPETSVAYHCTLLLLEVERVQARAPAAHGESATARVHYVEHRIREDVGFWVAEPREQSGAAAVYASRQMKGTTALVYALDIHDALTFATKTECEEWIRARELPLVACEHLVVSSLPPAPSPSPADREESAGGACPVPKCHAGMLRDHNGHDSVSCPVCDGTLTMEDLLAASPADAKEGTP